MTDLVMRLSKIVYTDNTRARAHTRAHTHAHTLRHTHTHTHTHIHARVHLPSYGICNIKIAHQMRMGLGKIKKSSHNMLFIRVTVSVSLIFL